MKSLDLQIDQQLRASNDIVNLEGAKRGSEYLKITVETVTGLFSLKFVSRQFKLARWIGSIAAEDESHFSSVLKTFGRRQELAANDEARFAERLVQIKIMKWIDSTLWKSIRSRVANMGKESVNTVSTIAEDDHSLLRSLKFGGKLLGAVGAGINFYSNFKEAKGPTEVRVAEATADTLADTALSQVLGDAGITLGALVPVPGLDVATTVGGFVGGNLLASWVEGQPWFNNSINSLVTDAMGE
jgi:hypothetical protein